MFVTKAFEHIRSIAIDPGLNNTGIAVFDIQVEPFKLLLIQAETLKADRLVDDSGLDDEDFIERHHKRYKLCNAFRKILEYHQPNIVVSESPFFDRRKPSSFAVLTEVITSLFDTVVEYSPLVRFSLVEPLLVKKTLGVAGQKGKDVVREAMAKQTEILKVLSDPLEQLDEHSIDAIGVGYTWITRKSGIIVKKE